MAHDRVSRKYSLLINGDRTKVMASDGIACRILMTALVWPVATQTVKAGRSEIMKKHVLVPLR